MAKTEEAIKKERETLAGDIKEKGEEITSNLTSFKSGDQVFKSTPTFEENDALEIFEIPTSSDKKKLDTTWNTETSSIGGTWSSVGESWANAWDDEGGWQQVSDAVGYAALSYINEKIEKLKEAWNTTKEVKVGDIVNIAAPYCMNWSTLGSKLSEKIGNMVTYVVTLGEVDSTGGLSGAAASVLKEALETALDDPGISSAVSNLKIVQSLADSFNAVSSTVESIKKIMTAVEPYLPWIEIISDLALAMFSGGTTGTTAIQKLQEYLATMMQELVVKVFEILRRLVFEIKITMPSLLVGALDTLKVNESKDLSECDDKTKADIKKNIRASSSYLSGKTYTGTITARKNNSYTNNLYKKTKSTLSSVSSVSKTWGNKIASGDLISSPNIDIDTTNLAIDWMSSISGFTESGLDLFEQFKDDWIDQKNYGYFAVSLTMAGYVLEARKAAGFSISDSNYSFLNTEDDGSIMTETKDSSVIEEARSTWDEISILQNSLVLLNQTT